MSNVQGFVPIKHLVRPRPSVQKWAELCQRAPWIAYRYREQNALTTEGNEVDSEVTVALTGGPRPERKVSGQLLDWAQRTFAEYQDVRFYPQLRIPLHDPGTGELLSVGTADLVVVVKVTYEGDPYPFTVTRVVVVDWKKKGQMFAGYLDEPGASLQQWNYLLGAALKFGATEGQIILALWDQRGVDPRASAIYPDSEWWPVLERIKAIPSFDPDGPEPEANKGPHCETCWQKLHCSAYLAPAISDVPVALVPFVEGGLTVEEMTPEQAAAGLQWLEDAERAVARANAMRKLVTSQLETYTATRGHIVVGDRQWGPIAAVTNRRPPTLAQLEEIGRADLIRPGMPTVKYDWRKAPKGIALRGPAMHAATEQIAGMVERLPGYGQRVAVDAAGNIREATAEEMAMSRPVDTEELKRQAREREEAAADRWNVK